MSLTEACLNKKVMSDNRLFTAVKPVDREFSLGLSYSDIMDLSKENLEQFLIFISREELIDWLQWNDPNGIYRDIDSLSEFGSILTKAEGVEIIKNQIFNS